MVITVGGGEGGRPRIVLSRLVPDTDPHVCFLSFFFVHTFYMFLCAHIRCIPIPLCVSLLFSEFFQPFRCFSSRVLVFTRFGFPQFRFFCSFCVFTFFRFLTCVFSLLVFPLLVFLICFSHLFLLHLWCFTRVVFPTCACGFSPLPFPPLVFFRLWLFSPSDLWLIRVSSATLWCLCSILSLCLWIQSPFG